MQRNYKLFINKRSGRYMQQSKNAKKKQDTNVQSDSLNNYFDIHDHCWNNPGHSFD